MNGYAGKILRLDLTEQKVSVHTLPATTSNGVAGTAWARPSFSTS